MRFLTKKKKEYIAILIGGLWYYTTEPIDSQDDLLDAAQFLIDLCEALGVSWEAVMKERKIYATARAYQDGCL